GMVGLQLYSIRAAMAKDPLGSLRKLADMGYVYVEHANYINRKFYGYTPSEFRKVLDDLGLKMISGHTVMGRQHWDESKQDFSDSWKYTVDDAAVLGQQYVVSPSMDNSMRNNYDDFRKYMDVFNKCGELCRKQGMKFGYHNHDFEFSEKLNNEKLFDIMMRSIDPDLVVVQLDIGNLYNGGAVALDVVKQYPGRFENIHVKDEIESSGGREKYESCVLGEGIVNARKVTKLATKIGGTKVYIIEQESYQGRDPMDCMRENLAVMKKWGY
ncbi:MAG TPA: sugar phosphate isomerase/epimerase family protein, partial [Bacteroidales bacterium]|nr:sugar phosphate isomerase/epimerase family protein [Bacteroidales bacterium]